MTTTSRQSFPYRYLRDWGLAPYLGMALFVATLPLYQSWENRVVLGAGQRPTRLSSQWPRSRSCLPQQRRGARSGARKFPAALPFWKLSFGVGVAAWGFAYLVAGLSSDAYAGRITDLNVIGSTIPGAAILEWVAMTAVVVAAIS